MKTEEYQMAAQVVTNIDLACPAEYRKQVLDWVYSHDGHLRSSGPLVKNFRADPTKFHIIGFISGSWTEEEIEKQLAAL